MVQSRRPVHAACHARHVEALATPVALLFAGPGRYACRACVADVLGVDIIDVYAVTARMLVTRAVRSAAAHCVICEYRRLGWRPSSLSGVR
jgi:hypothetical protein